MTSSAKTVLITGAAKRVGRAIALHLARQGWNVALHYSTSEAEAQVLKAELLALGVKACCIQADFSMMADAGEVLRQAAQEIGPVHCLINNASLFEKDGLGTLTPERFEHHQRINLLSPLLLIEAFAAQVHLHGARNASVINLGDGDVGWSLSSNYLSYALSKLGLMSLSGLLALELAPAIRINSIGLGLTLPGEVEDADMFERMKQRSPLKQLSSPDEVCRTIDFLLATPTITGQAILLSSGFHCHVPLDCSD